jgi:hypothetical protein
MSKEQDPKSSLIKLPRNIPLRVEGEIRMNDKELFLFDTWTQERTTIEGTDVEYYSLDVLGSKKDPLYNEPVEPVFKGPYKLRIVVFNIEFTPEAQERGFRHIYSAAAWIPRRTVEDASMGFPHEGDALRIWRTPFFDRFTEPEKMIDGTGFYFDVIKVDADGHPFDEPGFVGFRLEMKRRTEFNPDRRLLHP